MTVPVWPLIVAAALAASMPATVPLQAPSARTVAIGDIHGDFDDFVAILRRAGLIDEQLAWTGGATTLSRPATSPIVARRSVK